MGEISAESSGLMLAGCEVSDFRPSFNACLLMAAEQFGRRPLGLEGLSGPGEPGCFLPRVISRDVASGGFCLAV